MTAKIEKRYEFAGYVYTDRTRMGFSPKFTITRKVEDHASTDIVIWAANGHPAPHRRDIAETVAKLAAAYPDRRILSDTEEGLVTVWGPERSEPAQRPEPEPPAGGTPSFGPGSITDAASYQNKTG